MKYFDSAEISAAREAELAKQPAERLNARLNPDVDEGIREVADLLTCLPGDQRESAVRGFVLAMLLS